MAAAGRSARVTAEGWRDGGSVDDGGAEVELSLRLRTGSSSSSSAARRSMTIFYNGRVCAVDVTELQARAIITMASQQILTEQQDSSGSTGGTAVTQCGAHQNPSQPAPQRSAPLLASRPLRQGLGAAAGAGAASGLSMKRSLQQFLQKRKTRVATMGSPYAGGRPAMPS